MDFLETAAGEVLRERRKARHIQQHTLAEIVGVQRTSISNIENGRQALSLDMFYKIALALDENPGELLNTILHARPHLEVSESDVEDPIIRSQIKQSLDKNIKSESDRGSA